MKNLLFSLAFMLMGTFAFAFGENVKGENLNFSQINKWELKFDNLKFFDAEFRESTILLKKSCRIVSGYADDNGEFVIEYDVTFEGVGCEEVALYLMTLEWVPWI